MNRWSFMCLFFFNLIMLSFCSNNSLIELNGQWELVPDSLQYITIDNIEIIKSWQKTEVPASWHRLHPNLLDYQGVVWYRKSFIMKSLPSRRRFLLRFGAVDYFARVYVNRKLVGEHEGGYTPFEFDVTEQLLLGNNEILVRVVDPVSDETGTERISYWHIPHGKQNWYVQTSGIWQEVKLVAKPAVYVKRVQINSQIDGTFQARIYIENSQQITDPIKLKLTLREPGGRVVFAANRRVDLALAEMEFSGQITKPQLWDVGQPNLYTLEVRLGDDIVRERFGFREFCARDGKFYLNNHPFYMIAALDQDFYPETVYETPSEEYLYDEMRKALELGLNTLRCHIKVPDPRYLKVADELGLLVWYEIPNWDVFHESVKIRSRQTFDEMLERDWNHPSLVIISLINESWGIDLGQPDQRQWLKNEFSYAKSAAQGRLIVDNSACWGNFHLKTDINDYHTYWAIPENHNKFSRTVKEIARRPDWLFSPHGDAAETGEEVLLISEFGNWGLPKLPEKLPFWFNRQFLDDWITMPNGVHQRFEDFGYRRIFNDYNELAECSQRAQVRALKWEIEEIRLQPEIQGYVITEFTDINWECNGLLDMWRNFKADHEVLTMIQQPDIIIPRIPKYAYWDDESVDIQLTVSHYSKHNFSDVKIHLIDDEKTITETTVCIGSQGVFPLAAMTIPAKPVEISSRRRIDFQLADAENNILAQNFIEFTVLPRCQPIPNTTNRGVIFTTKIDDSILSHLHDGQNVICLAGPESVFPAGFPFKIQSREADWYDGNWASNLNWVVHQTGPFADLRGGPTLGFEALNAMPDHVITEISAEQFENVLAGMYVGWLHLNSAYLVQMRVGAGKLLLTTFQLENGYGKYPFVTNLRDALSRYVSSAKCKPVLDWKR